VGPVRAGLALVPLALSIFVASTIAGRRLHNAPPRIVISTGLLLAAAGCALQAGLDEQSTATSILAGLVVTGVGVRVGLTMPAMDSALLGSVAPQRFGIAVGVMTTCRQLGQSLGVAVLGLVFATGASPADGLNRVCLTAAAAGLVAATLGLLLIRESVGARV
jgi:hypothetical protein